ncbi:MAG: hypothetical protein L6R35_003693 [Caloplaca aegaea]|nr:MAG: hypothetical protein L6R35_003693 [Caloplaca aegaea]
MSEAPSRPRKFDDKQKVMKKNSQGLFVYNVEVVSALYNNTNHRWEYTLKDFAGTPIGGTTKETDLQ